MLDKATKRDSRSATQVSQPFMFPGLAFNMWGPALSCSAEWNTKLHEGFTTLSSEWQEFLSRRMKEDVGLLQLVGQSPSPEQAWSTYVKFWQSAAEDYAQEFAVMTKLTGELMSSSIGAMQRSMEEAASEVLPLTKAA